MIPRDAKTEGCLNPSDGFWFGIGPFRFKLLLGSNCVCSFLRGLLSIKLLTRILGKLKIRGCLNPSGGFCFRGGPFRFKLLLGSKCVGTFCDSRGRL